MLLAITWGGENLMVEIRKPIPVEEAVHKVMQYQKYGKKETISLHDCDQRRLAEPIIATNHVPSFDKSPYDGFALRSIDTADARSEEHTSELQSRFDLVCRLLLEKKNTM